MVCYPSLKASKVRNPLNGLTYPPSSCVSIFASKCVYVFPSSSFNFTYILHRNFCHVHLLELSARPVHFMFCFVLFCFVLFCFVLFCFVLFCFVLLFVCDNCYWSFCFGVVDCRFHFDFKVCQSH